MTVSLLGGCRRLEEKIDSVSSRVDQIENTRIKTISEQIKSIETSLPKLEQADRELKGYIESLETTADNLQRSITESEAKITELEKELDRAVDDAKKSDSALKSDLEQQISTAKSDILAQLASAKSLLEGRLGQIEQTIEQLKAKDTGLEKKITDLKVYADGEISSAKDWASATFATLELYNGLTSDIAGIRGTVESLNASVSALEESLSTTVSTEVAKAVESIRDQLKSDIASEITKGYTDAISAARTDMEKAWKADIAKSVAASEASMKEWVNGALTGYSTVSETDSKIAALKSELEGRIAAEREYAEQLTKSLREELSTRTAANAELLSSIRSDLTSLDERVKSSAEKIAENSESISANSSAIARNASAISSSADELSSLRELLAENRRLIDANTELTASNKTAISSLDGRLSSAETTATEAERAAASNAETICRNAEAIASNASLISKNVSAIADSRQAIADNASEIETMKASLASAKDELMASYTSAISAAIERLDGKLTGDIAEAVSEANASVAAEISNVEERVSALEARVTALEKEMSSIREELTKLRDAIESLTGRVAGVEEQAAAIGATVEKLEKTDAELKESIGTLTTACDDLRNAIADTDSKIAAVSSALEQAKSDAEASGSAMRDELSKSITDAKADVTAQLNAVRSELAGRLSQAEETLSSLTAKDAELEKKITDLKAYVDGGIQSAKDWVSATFATLEQYESVAEELAGIKSDMESLGKSLASTETKLRGEWTDDIEAAVAPVHESIGKTVTEITDAYTAAITAAKRDVEIAYGTAISEAISESERSLKSWVGAELDGYLTAADAEARLSAQKSDMETELASQKAYLQGLIDNLSSDTEKKLAENGGSISTLESRMKAVENTASDNASQIAALQSQLSEDKDALTEAYRSAIKAAVDELDGRLSGKLSGEIASANTRLDNAVKSMETKIAALDARVQSCEADIAVLKSTLSSLQSEISDLKSQMSRLVNRITSISYIPKYSDGTELVPFTRDGDSIVSYDLTLRFKILPASAASEIASLWKSALSAEAVYTMTRAAGDMIGLDVVGATSQSGGILSVTLSSSKLGNDFLTGKTSASVILMVSDGTTEIMSNFIPLVPAGFGVTNSFMEYLVKKFDSDGDGIMSQSELSAVEEINVSGLGFKSLAGVELLNNLKHLDCSNNELASLDISNNPLLETLNLSNNPKITILNLDKNPCLKELEAAGLGISELDLTEIEQLSKLDTQDNSNIEKIICPSRTWLSNVSSFRPTYVVPFVSPGGLIIFGPADIDGLQWSALNAGATLGDYFGGEYTYSSFNSVCPSGWKMPTDVDFKSLSANYSAMTTFNGVQGRWFSGSQTYSDSVPAIFFPVLKGETYGYYWSSQSYGANTYYDLYFNSKDVSLDYASKFKTYSVRCIKK